jgi:hypothetical protein
MTPEEIQSNFVEKCDDLDILIEMVMDRDAGEALEMITILHEIAKLYVADQLPTPERVTNYGFAADESLEVIFSGRHVRTAKNLIRHLKLVDDDGIPL